MASDAKCPASLMHRAPVIPLSGVRADEDLFPTPTAWMGTLGPEQADLTARSFLAPKLILWH